MLLIPGTKLIPILIAPQAQQLCSSSHSKENLTSVLVRADHGLLNRPKTSVTKPSADV